MKKRLFILQILLLLMAMNCVHGQQNKSELIDDIGNNLKLSFVHYGVDLNAQDQVSEEFDTLMNRLVQLELETPSTVAEENTFETKILNIAKYKAQRPELFDVIAAKYIYGVNNPRFRAPSSPQLEVDHITEEYRLVWEYFLLKPVSKDMSSQFDKRIGEALAIINNSATVRTLYIIYQNSLEKNVNLNGLIIDKRKDLLLTIARIPSEQNLRVMLTLVSEDKSMTKDKDGIEWNPNDYLGRLMTGKENLKNQQIWSSIVSELNPKMLDTKSLEVLRNLKLK